VVARVGGLSFDLEPGSFTFPDDWPPTNLS
jgi:hypothetical protein